MSSTTGKVLPNEKYETPIPHIETLIKHINFRPGDTFLEPCKGEHGNIFNAVPLPENQKHYTEIEKGTDYLKTFFTNKFSVIMTNPPFSQTESFLKKSFSELATDGTLIYLQRMNYLGSEKRVKFWNEIGFPQKTPILIPRPRFALGNSDSCEYCWYIWDFGNRMPLVPNGISHLISSVPRKKNRKKSTATTSNVELDDIELDDIELDDIELDDIELDDIELDDIELDDIELDDIELEKL